MSGRVLSYPDEEQPCWLSSLGDESKLSDGVFPSPDEEQPWWLSSLGDESRIE